MALTLSLSTDGQTLTVVSDKRVTAEVREPFRITVEAADESKVYDGSTVKTPRSVSQVNVVDSRGVVWSKLSDDEVTAVFRRA